MADMDLITVEVAYALPHQQKIIELLVEPGTSAYQAAVRSGITNVFPDLDLEESKMGIFGQALGTKGLKPPKEYELQHGRSEERRVGKACRWRRGRWRGSEAGGGRRESVWRG